MKDELCALLLGCYHVATRLAIWPRLAGVLGAFAVLGACVILARLLESHWLLLVLAVCLSGLFVYFKRGIALAGLGICCAPYGLYQVSVVLSAMDWVLVPLFVVAVTMAVLLQEEQPGRTRILRIGLVASAVVVVARLFLG